MVLLASTDNTTVLFVFGDHGMTPDGNHGGASEDETGAALFCYSKGLPLIKGGVAPKPYPGSLRTVHQVDLVPTLSLLLGLPIPFGNLGQIIPEMFQHGRQGAAGSPSEDDLRYVHGLNEALAMNAEQVLRYLKTYHSNELANASHSTRQGGSAAKVSEGRFSAGAMTELVDKHANLTSRHQVHGEYLRASNSTEKPETQVPTPSHHENVEHGHHHHHHGHGRETYHKPVVDVDLAQLSAVTEGFQGLLESALSMCQQQWTQFDLPAMARGIVIAVLSICFTTLTEWRAATYERAQLPQNGRKPLFAIARPEVLVGLCIVGLLSIVGLHFTMGWDGSLIESTSILSVVAYAVHQFAYRCRNSTTKLSEPSNKRPAARGVSFSFITCMFVMFFHAASLFSNSYLDASLGCHWFLSLCLLTLVVREHVTASFEPIHRTCSTSSSRSQDPDAVKERGLLAPASFLQQVVRAGLNKSRNFVALCALLGLYFVPVCLRWALNTRRVTATCLPYWRQST